MENPSQIQRMLLLGLFACLLFLSFEILKFFIVPVVWAAILAYITWPAYQLILRNFGHRHNLSAITMTTILMVIIGVPFIIAIFLLQLEGRELFLRLQKQIYNGGIQLPDFVSSIPLIGNELKRMVNQLNANPHDITQSMRNWMQGHVGYGKMVLGEISKNIFKLVLAFFTLFFFYRDGTSILDEVRRALNNIIGYRVHAYLHAIGETTRAVVYGVGLTALAQALLAGLGYWVAGIPNPLMLTFATFLLALIPFGTPFSWGGVCLWLLSQGHNVEALGIGIWGLCVVSWVDNIIRPLVISGATKIPFLLIMFGVLGGVASFGMVGVFIGPVILAIMLAVWREWLHQKLIEPEQEELFEEKESLV